MKNPKTKWYFQLHLVIFELRHCFNPISNRGGGGFPPPPPRTYCSRAKSLCKIELWCLLTFNKSVLRTITKKFEVIMSKNEDFTTIWKSKGGKFTIWGNINCENCGKINNFEMAAVALNFNLWTWYWVHMLVKIYISTCNNNIQKILWFTPFLKGGWNPPPPGTNRL